MVVLPAPLGPRNPDDLTPLDLERDAVDRAGPSEVLDQVFDADHEGVVLAGKLRRE